MYLIVFENSVFYVKLENYRDYVVFDDKHAFIDSDILSTRVHQGLNSVLGNDFVLYGLALSFDH